MEKILVVGLGNPGEKFVGTRHNVGQEVVERIVASQDNVSWKQEGDVYRFCSIGNVVYLIPLTYMNESGKAVALYMQKNGKVQLLVVHDDLELPLGEVKYVEGGSAKGHNGVRSIQDVMGTIEVPRLRLGVGRPTNNEPVDEYVLSKFAQMEKGVVEQMGSAAILQLQERTAS